MDACVFSVLRIPQKDQQKKKKKKKKTTTVFIQGPWPKSDDGEV